MADIPAGDYEKGKQVYKQRCLQCHVVDSKATKTGPTLHGVIGRTSGTVEGFDYSAANKNKVCYYFNYLYKNNLFRESSGPEKPSSNTSLTPRNISPEPRWCSLV